MKMKSIFLTIALLVIGLAVVQAQTPAIPLPPLPNVTLTMPPQPMGGTYNVNVTSAQLRRLLEIRDQRKYIEYLYSIGNITEEEYERRIQNSWNEETNLTTSIGMDQVTYLMADDVVKNELAKLWVRQSPGWHDQAIRECIGFTLQQPQGTRAASQVVLTMIRMYLTPATDQVFNNIVQQFERGLGIKMTYNAETNSYTYGLPANRSADGKPHSIEVTMLHSPSSIAIVISK